MSYGSLISNRFNVLMSEYFGSYQGDAFFVVEGPGDTVGLIVVGYGSCSGCDWYEATITDACECSPPYTEGFHYGYSDEDECPGLTAALNEMEESLTSNVTYQTKEALAAYLEDEYMQESKYYFYEDGAKEAMQRMVNQLLA